MARSPRAVGTSHAMRASRDTRRSGRLDRVSLGYLLLIVIGVPLSSWAAHGLLVAAGADPAASLWQAHLAAVAFGGGAVFLVSRQRQIIADDRALLLEQLWGATEDYRRIAENASDIIYTAGSDRLVTWISPSVARVLGWTPAEVRGRTIASFLHEEDQANTEEVRSRIYSGEPYETPIGGFIMRFALKAGGYRWMSINLKAMLGSDGRHLGVIGGLTDVDELVRARERAEANERLLQVTSDALLDPQVLMRAVRDADGAVTDFRYVQVNQATAEYLHASREQLIGRRMLESSPALATSGLFDLFVSTLQSDAPLSVHDFLQRSDILGRDAYFDIQARRVDADQLALTWRDVTEAAEAARRLQESETRFRLLAENGSDVVVLSDVHMRLNWVSPSATRTLGWTPGELSGHSADEYVHPDDLPDLRVAVEWSTRTGEEIRQRYRWRRPDGTYRWMEAAGRPVADDGSGKPGRVVQLRDIDAEVQAQHLLHQRATVDDLTRALMREAAFDRLAAIGTRTCLPGDEIGILFIDIDEFKAVNDRWGHATGDDVLRTVANRTRASIRGADVVARMGGDEFLVILEGIGSLQHAIQVAEKIRVAAAQPIPTWNGDVGITLSIGATLIGHGEPADSTIARADEAMYRGKDAGRNRVIAIPIA